MDPIVLVVLAFAAGAASAVIVSVILNRRELDEPLDWTEAAYEPRHEQPRAVTRIHSNDLDWEIK